jgi:hypothetical protein
MIGTNSSTAKSTIELETGDTVVVDHQRFEVLAVTFYSNGTAQVMLISEFGPDWDLGVAKEDYEEPLWETV